MKMEDEISKEISVNNKIEKKFWVLVNGWGHQLSKLIGWCLIFIIFYKFFFVMFWFVDLNIN